MGLMRAAMRLGRNMIGGVNARIPAIEAEIASLPRSQQTVVADVFQREGADAAERLLSEIRRLSAASPNPMHWTS
jgi:hypothetical protein